MIDLERQTMSDNKQWIGIKDLAAELDIPVTTIYQWRSRGLAPRGARFGRTVRFRRADVDAWIAERLEAEGVQRP